MRLAHRTDSFGFLHQLLDRFHELVAEIPALLGEVARQIVSFQVLPQPLDRVKVGAVGWQVNRLDMMPAQALGLVSAGVVEHK